MTWRGIYVDPTGRVDNCCISRNYLGNINQDRLEDIINGSRSIEIRTKMQNGEIPDGCRVCYRGESGDLRANFLKKFSGYDRSIYDHTQKFELNYLDLRWRNTCNSACIYCSPDLSSKIAAEMGIEIRSDHDMIEKSKAFISSRIHEIKSVYLAGGEPLLIRENEWLLQTLKNNNQHPHILVNTNLSQINNRVFELLCEFPMVTWMISGEHVGEHYEYIRYGSSWQQFDQNVNELIKLTQIKGHDYTFNLVYLALNLQGFWQYVDWIKSKNIQQYRIHPAWISNGNFHQFDPRNLLPHRTQPFLEILKQRAQSGDTIDRPLAEFLLESWQQPWNGKEDESSIVGLLNKIDQKRQLDSKKLWPELRTPQPNP